MSAAVIYGVQPVLEAIKAGRKITTLYLARAGSSATRRLITEARAHGAKVLEADKKELDERAGSDRHQGVVALLEGEEAVPYKELDDILALAAEEGEAPLVLVLDGIQDPHNVGALIRSAWALGAHGVVLPKHRAAPVTAGAVKASAGAAAHLPIVRVANVKHALDRLKEEGVWSAAADLGGEPLEATRLDGPLAIVVGSEDKGVRPSVAATCDFRIRIELARDFDSLNASVAGGILLYEARRQRNLAKTS